MPLPQRSRVFASISLTATLLYGTGCQPKETAKVAKSVLGFSRVSKPFGSHPEYAVSAAHKEAFLASAPKALAPLVDSAGGAAAADIDGDGDVDWVLIRGDRPAAVYLNQLDKQILDLGFVEAEAALLPALDPFALSPVLVDLVGDSKPDLLVAGFGDRHIALFENRWPKAFVDVTEASGLSAALPSFGFAVGDVDQDGDIDVFVGRYGNKVDPDEPAASELLWLNNGKKSFTDASDKLGDWARSAANTENVLTPNFVDMDADGDLDLVLAGERGATNILHNTLVASDLQVAGGAQSSADAGAQDAGLDAGSDAGPAASASSDAGSSPASRSGFGFEQLAKPGILPMLGGRGSAFGDIDLDGEMDWLISGGASDDEDKFSSKLFINDNNTLKDDSAALGVSGRGFGLGACAEDFNNDGLMDFLQVADADYLVPKTIADTAPSREFRGAMHLGKVDSLGEFEEVGSRYGFDDIIRGRGVLCFDYDKDGDVDVIVTALGEEAQLFRNSLDPKDESGANYFGVRLVFEGANSTGLGAQVRLRTRGVTQVREVRNANGLFGQGPATIHFGLAAETFISELRVIWPNGDTVAEVPEYLNDVVRVSYRAPD